MDTLIGFAGAMLALLVLMVVYIGAATAVMQLVGRLLPKKDGHEATPNRLLPTS